jgi:hypothetical protein
VAAPRLFLFLFVEVDIILLPRTGLPFWQSDYLSLVKANTICVLPRPPKNNGAIAMASRRGVLLVGISHRNSKNRLNTQMKMLLEVLDAPLFRLVSKVSNM